ncbi:MAG: hypothetical protein ISS64_08635 [Desulfobacterales bacterium]|nr:hypothetical protein [Desulfobacterales bacterium]
MSIIAWKNVIIRQKDDGKIMKIILKNRSADYLSACGHAQAGADYTD